MTARGTCLWCDQPIRLGRAAGPAFWAHITLLGPGYRIQCEGRETRATLKPPPSP